MTSVSKFRSLNTAGANTAGSSGLCVTTTPAAPHCWRISSPYLAKAGKWTKSRARPVPFPFPPYRVEKPLGPAAIEPRQGEPRRVRRGDLARDGRGGDLALAEEDLGEERLPVGGVGERAAESHLFQ